MNNEAGVRADSTVVRKIKGGPGKAKRQFILYTFPIQRTLTSEMAHR
jgi:hypothetical protein